MPTDAPCCGTLGSIELLTEAADALGRLDLREGASRQLRAVLHNARVTGDYRLSSGIGRFNFGLFGGIAGIGDTMLRRVEPSLPNVLIWE